MDEHDGSEIAAPTRKRMPGARREAIMHAAVALFAERGYARTTTKAIAHAAGVAEGTIYKYFSSKQDLLFAFLEPEVLQPLDDLLRIQEGEDEYLVMRRLIADRFALWQRNSVLLKAIISEALFNPELARMLAQRLFVPASQVAGAFFMQRQLEGKLRPVHPVLTLRLMFGHTFAYFLLWNVLFPDSEQFPDEMVIDEITRTILLGVLKRNDDVAHEEAS